MVSEVNMSSCKLIKALIGKKDLAEHLKTIWSSPGLLHSLDMLGFCDGRAKAIGSSKGTNEFDIVIKRVLLRKIEVIMNTARPKDFVMVMKSLKSIVHGGHAVCIMYIVSSYVAKLQKGMNCLHHIVWYMAFDCW